MIRQWIFGFSLFRSSFTLDSSAHYTHSAAKDQHQGMEGKVISNLYQRLFGAINAK